jgi:hypothetical protein
LRETFSRFIGSGKRTLPEPILFGGDASLNFGYGNGHKFDDLVPATKKGPRRAQPFLNLH